MADVCLMSTVTLELNHIIGPTQNIPEPEVEVEKNEPTTAAPNTQSNWEQNKKDKQLQEHQNPRTSSTFRQLRWKTQLQRQILTT